MKITYSDFTVEEILEIVYTALCNGLSQLLSYEVEFTYDKTAYAVVKSKLESESPSNAPICLECILIEYLKCGQTITFTDAEGSIDTHNLTLAKIQSNWNKVNQEIRHAFVTDEDDVDTADCLLQVLIYGDVIYS